MSSPKEDPPASEAPDAAVEKLPSDTPAAVAADDRSSDPAPSDTPVESEKKASAPSTPAASSSAYLPGSVVLAKLKGFPPWPAMVLTDDLIPPHILKLKPKSSASTPGSAKLKRKSLPADEEENTSGPNAFPVRFFNDNNYMWASRGDLKTLTTEQIKKYIETTAKGAKKDKALVTAYKIALEPPALEEFAKGSEDEASEDEAEADGKEDEDTKMEDAPDGNEKEKKGAATKKRKSAPIEDGDANGSKKKRKSSITKGNGEAAAKNGEKKPRAKTSATKKKEAATAAAVKETRDEQTKHVLFLRHKLQKVFMTKDKPPQEEDMESMDKLFGKLENFQGLDLAMIRSTKINKVLKAIAKMTSIPLETKYEFKSRSQKLLDAWNAKFDLGSPAPTQPPTEAKSEPKQEASEEKKDALEEKKEAPGAEKVEEKKEEEKKDEEKKDEKKEEAEKSEPKATPAAVPEVAADAAAEKEPVKTEAPVAEAGA